MYYYQHEGYVYTQKETYRVSPVWDILLDISAKRNKTIIKQQNTEKKEVDTKELRNDNNITWGEIEVILIWRKKEEMSVIFSGGCWLTPWPTSLLGSHFLPSTKLDRVHSYKITESSRRKIHYVSLLIVKVDLFLLFCFVFWLLPFRVRKKRHNLWVIHNWTYANAVFRGLSASKPERVHTLLGLAFSTPMKEKKKASWFIRETAAGKRLEAPSWTIETEETCHVYQIARKRIEEERVLSCNSVHTFSYGKSGLSCSLDNLPTR